MKIDTSDYLYLREVEYEPEIDAVRFAVVCHRNGLDSQQLRDEIMQVGGLIDASTVDL